MNTEASVADAFRDLAAMNTAWTVEIGRPEGPGWICGTGLRPATSGAFHAWLLCIGERARMTDWTVAASFARRFGRSPAFAIVPFLKFAGVQHRPIHEC